MIRTSKKDSGFPPTSACVELEMSSECFDSGLSSILVGATIPSTPKLRDCHHGLDKWFTKRCIPQFQGNILSSSECHFPRKTDTHLGMPGGRPPGW